MTVSFKALLFLAWLAGGFAQSIPNIEALRRAVESTPSSAEARRQLGQGYFRDRQSKLALDQYREALRLEPRNENLYLEAAAIFLAEGLAEQAETILLEATKRFPDSRSERYNLLYHDLAELWTSSGRLQKARNAMMIAARMEGPVATAVLYKRIGDFNTDLLNFDEALSAYTRALKLDPENPTIHLAMGKLHLQRNSPADALQEFTRVISRDPRNPGALGGIAEVHRRAGRFEEAAAAAAKALETDPNNAGNRYIRGAALVRLGKSVEGQRELQEYRRLQAKADAENHRLRQIQAFSATGLSRLLQGQIDEAIVMFKKGIAAYPDVAELYVNLGLAQSQAGQHRAAIATFVELLDRRLGTDTLVHRYLAEEYASLGEAEASKEHQSIYFQKREAELGGRPPR